MECLQIGHNLLCRSKIGFGDDLKQWCPSAIQVNAGVSGNGIVYRFSRILFEVSAENSDRKN